MKRFLKRVFSLALVACVGLAALQLPRATKASAAETTETKKIINTETYIGNLIGAPSVITRYQEAEQLAQYADYERQYRPSNVIVSVTDDLTAKNDEGTALGSLADAYSTNKTNKILTIAQIETQTAAKAFSAWLTEENVYDISVMSSSAEIIPYVWTAYSTSDIKVRAVQGYFGITNDVAYEVADWQKQILPTQGYSTKNEKTLKTATFEADIMTYDRTTEKAECQVFQYEIHEGYADVILSRKADGYTLYSMPVRVELTAQNEPDPELPDSSLESSDELPENSESADIPAQSDSDVATSDSEAPTNSGSGTNPLAGCFGGIASGVAPLFAAGFVYALKKKREK